MSIKARCGQCQANFSVRNELAGKRVKCPRCSQPITIPNAPSERTGTAGPARNPKTSQAAAPRAQGPSDPMFIGAAGAGPAGSAGGGGARRPAFTQSANYYNPLLDLLDEAEVAAKPRGNSCENCGAEVQASAIICVECGYNLETGERLETAVLVDDADMVGSSNMSDAERILAKAEKEIDERPVTGVGQNFGDGKESILISLVAVGAFVAFIGVGVGAILGLDWFMDKFELTPSAISMTAAITIYVLGAVWISIIAFTAHPGHGIACVATLGLYCIMFGFMQGKGAIVPTIIMLAAGVIGLATYALSGEAPQDYSWMHAIQRWQSMRA